MVTKSIEPEPYDSLEQQVEKRRSEDYTLGGQSFIGRRFFDQDRYADMAESERAGNSGDNVVRVNDSIN
jgi:hypothetical protein